MENNVLRCCCAASDDDDTPDNTPDTLLVPISLIHNLIKEPKILFNIIDFALVAQFLGTPAFDYLELDQPRVE